ncbi:MAG: Ku protein, partial [Acidobacteriota bacterium]|nr:Ku protein [Acidobacteriota bacterium]
HTLFHSDEVRAREEFHADPALAKTAEIDLAVKLVEAFAGPFEPAKFKDKYRDRLKEAIAQKVGSGAVTESSPAPAAAPVIDIMAALKASLSKARKPVTSESAAVAPVKKHRASSRH